ncbi:SPOSA6832_02338, partial [Sporobolomyces salmonicolor]
MLAPTTAVKTPPTDKPSEFDLNNIKHAIFQGELGLSEKGVPIGAALVRNDGVVIGVGRNRRVQQGSATRHGELTPPPAACTRVEVVNLNLDSCKQLMNKFIELYPETWNEDIGEE